MDLVFSTIGWLITGVLLVQIVFGGLMAGMRAGLLHPYFPMFIKGSLLWDALWTNTDIGLDTAINYEPARSVKAFVQVLHRGTAYLLTALIAYFCWMLQKAATSTRLTRGNYFLLGMLFIQLAGALLLLGSLLYVNFQIKKNLI